MSNAKHTPGPWNTAMGMSGYAGSPAEREDRVERPTRGTWKFMEKGLLVTADESKVIGTFHVAKGAPKANASLIAAAPELLAALEAVVSQIDPKATKEIGLGNYLNARAAIAKATGVA